MSKEHTMSTSDVAFVFTGVFALIALMVALLYQVDVVGSAANHREIQREVRIASEPVGISRVQMQGVEQEVRLCRLAEIAPVKKWHNRTSAEKLILEREQRCIDQMVRKIAIVDAEAARALAHVMGEGPFNVSEDVEAIGRDDPQALRALAGLLAR